MGVIRMIEGQIRTLDNGDDTSTPLLGIRQATNSTTVTIANNAALSSNIDTMGHGPRGIAVETPSAWTAANIGFEASQTGGTATTEWAKLYGESGSRVQITNIGTASANLYMAPADCWALGTYKYFRLASLNTSTGAAVNQAAARTLKVKMLG